MRRRRLPGFFFKSEFPPGWWRPVLYCAIFNTIQSWAEQMGAGTVELPAVPPHLTTGCRADTQIACPGTGHRICNVQRCDGTEDCPR